MNGHLFVITAPSGAGKTTLVRALCQAFPDLDVSVSYTTRTPRVGEKDGIDYYFLTTEQFEQKVERNEFIEHARVYGQDYGTGREHVLERLRLGRDVLLEIDVQGAMAVQNAFPDAVMIFILPPTLAVLAQRLQDRGQNSREDACIRLSQARTEIQKARHFDYLVVNAELDTALNMLSSIIIANRSTSKRMRSVIDQILDH